MSWLKSNRFLLFFLFSLLFFFGIFFLTRHFMTNFDENDHLAAGFFMKNGLLLYKDFFSHHFPLPYYWTSLFTPFWSSSAIRTITVFRLSLLVLYLIVFLSVFTTLKSRPARFSFSLWLFFLSLFFPLYHGNLVLSETFSAIFISAIFWLTIPLILKWEEVSTTKLLLLIVFASAAFWTQPLLIFLSLIPLLLAKKHSKLLGLILLLNSLPLFIFLFRGQLTEFWHQGVVFNFFVYPKYFVDDLPSGNKYIQTFLYFLKNELYLFTHLGNPTQFFQFILHLSFYWLTYRIIKTKKLVFILTFFLLFLAVRVREVKIIPGQIFNFGIYPYLLVSLAAFSLLVYHLFQSKKIVAAILSLLFIGLSLYNFSPILRQSLITGRNYDEFWSYRQRYGELLNQLSRPDERILVYPHDVDLYTLSQRFPPDRFLYWFPWVNQVYKPERLTGLSKNPPSVIFMGSLAFKGDMTFYGQFFPHLLDNYQNVKKDNQDTPVWIRKDLVSRLNSPYN